MVGIMKYLHVKNFLFFLLYTQGFGPKKAHLPEDCMLWSLRKKGVLMGGAKKPCVLTLAVTPYKQNGREVPLTMRMLPKINCSPQEEF